MQGKKSNEQKLRNKTPAHLLISTHKICMKVSTYNTYDNAYRSS